MSWLEEFGQALRGWTSLEELRPLAEGWEENPRQAALEALLASDLFDAEDYLRRYPDVARAGTDPVWHFVMHGVEEKREFKKSCGSGAQALAAVYEFEPEREDSISVIIPAYNVGQYLERAVESVFAQTHKNIEILIYEDCSQDNTWEVAQALAARDGRVRLLRGEQNLGQGYGRNRCLEVCQGQYCAFLDADDYYSKPEFLQNQLAMLRGSGADVVISPYLRTRKGRTWQDECETGEFSGMIAAEKFLARKFSTHAPGSKLIRSRIAKVSHFNEYGFSQDVPFVLKCLVRARRVIVGGEGGYLYDMTTVSSWRPPAPTPLHFYSSLRLLVEITLACWRYGLNVGEFTALWREEHGKRIREYLAVPANLQAAQEILAWFGWTAQFFEQLVPEIRFYFPTRLAAGEPRCLEPRFGNHIASLRAGLEREIAAYKGGERRGVVIWAAHLAGGGLERVASQLGRAMAEEFDITYVLDEPQRIDYEIPGRALMTDMFDLEMQRELAGAAYIFDFHWKRPDRSYPLCQFMLEKYRYKYVPTVHNTERCEAYFELIYQGLTKIGCAPEEFPAIVCVSGAVRDVFESLYGKHENAKIVYNPVDIEGCAGVEPITRPYQYVLFAGRLNKTEHKGIDLLVEAWAQAAARKQGIRLVMAGAGDVEFSIMEKIRQYELDNNIEIIGFRDNVHAWMKGALFTILPSRWEGFSMTLIESLACGTPVLATRVGGAPEIIVPGINGELVAPEDVGELASGIERLAETAKLIRGDAIISSVRKIDVGGYKGAIETALAW